MSPPGLRLLQSLPLQQNSSNSANPSSATSFSGSVSWSSTDDALSAAAAPDSVLTARAVPDPRSDLSALNLKLDRVSCDPAGQNPYLEDTDVDW